MAEEVERLTGQEQKEWMRGYPYSMAFTQGVVHRLSQAAAQVAHLEADLVLVRHDHEVAVEAHCELAEMCTKLVKANAAKDAALRDMGFHAPRECSARLGGGYPRCNTCLSALSDAGEGKACGECGLAVSLCTCVPALRKWPTSEGWLEVREQAIRTIRALFRFVPADDPEGYTEVEARTRRTLELLGWKTGSKERTRT